MALTFPTIDAMRAFDTTGTPDGTQADVTFHARSFVLSKTSRTIVDNTLTVLARPLGRWVIKRPALQKIGRHFRPAPT